MVGGAVPSVRTKGAWLPTLRAMQAGPAGSFLRLNVALLADHMGRPSAPIAARLLLIAAADCRRLGWAMSADRSGPLLLIVGGHCWRLVLLIATDWGRLSLLLAAADCHSLMVAR